MLPWAKVKDRDICLAKASGWNFRSGEQKVYMLSPCGLDKAHQMPGPGRWLPRGGQASIFPRWHPQ